MYHLVSLKVFQEKNRNAIAQKLVEIAIRHKDESAFCNGIIHDQYGIIMVDAGAVEEAVKTIEENLCPNKKKIEP